MNADTLDDETDAGKIRAHNNIYVMDGITGDIARNPPHYEELEKLLSDLERFFNQPEKTFIHPVIKGIIIHFMLSYIHHFVDGNGRAFLLVYAWSGLLADRIHVDLAHHLPNGKNVWEGVSLYRI
jgi:fido (protein-threonine AMPylation protein)